MPTPPRPAPRRRRWKIAALVLLGLLAGGGFAFWRALRYEPTFYVASLNVPVYRATESTQQLEGEVRRLERQIQTDESWSTTITDEQLNGWLALELPRHAGRRLPDGLYDPRVVIDAERIRLAARYERDGIETVLSVELTVETTDEPNRIGLRVGRVRAGALPAPLERWIDQAPPVSTDRELPVAWRRDAKGPMLLVDWPARSSAWPGRRLTIETIELGAGRITLGGTSRPE